MDDDWRLLLTIPIDVLAVEAARQLEIKLYRTRLPRSSQRVFHHDVDFRPVECAATLFNRVVSRSQVPIQDAAYRCLGPIPRLQVSDVSLRPRTKPQHEIQIEEFVEFLSKFENAVEFLLYLLFRDEDVGVILLEFLRAH